nr:PREDICTED: odorant receptor 2a-like [Linepithema humile]
MEILELITDDWTDFANSDTSMRTITRKAKTSAHITNGMVILHTTAIVAYCLGVITAGADVTNQTTELPYFNKLDLPFSVTTQRMYRLVLMSEFLHLILSNCLAGVVNAILLSLVLHVGGQIEILQCWLEQLTVKNIENREEQSIVIAIRKIILKHQKIINFTEMIENIYTYIGLILFVSNSMLICSIGFLIVAAIGTDDAAEQIIKCVLFFTLTNLEAFIFCYAGEYLKTKSKAIEFATYSCAWYNLKPKDSRVLLFIISRSQKQLTLTAGKMMDLNLESFASIMNASGSYLSVLLAMQ